MINIECIYDDFFEIKDTSSGNAIEMFFDGTFLKMYFERGTDSNDEISLRISKEEDRELYQMFQLVSNHLYTWISEKVDKITGGANAINIVKNSESITIFLSQKETSLDKSFIVKNNASKYSSLLVFLNAFVVYLNRCNDKTKTPVLELRGRNGNRFNKTYL